MPIEAASSWVDTGREGAAGVDLQINFGEVNNLSS